jgi:hypothetical protein
VYNGDADHLRSLKKQSPTQATQHTHSPYQQGTMAHTREKQVAVLTDLSIHGSARKAARDHKVSRNTIAAWITQATQERQALSQTEPLEGELVGTTAQEKPAASPLPLPDWHNPDITKPVWYEAEQNALDVVTTGIKVLAEQQRTQPLTPSELYTVAKLAETAHRIRTGQDRLSVPQAGQGETVIVEWVRAERRG